MSYVELKPPSTKPANPAPLNLGPQNSDSAASAPANSTQTSPSPAVAPRAVEPVHSVLADKPAGPNEFLSFTLGSEEYGIEILKVQEIRGYDAITHIVNAPTFIKGVVNLRGIIVPIVDMRIKFNLPHVEYNEFTVVIILNVSGRVMGIVVDSVSDVITLSADQIKPAPDFSAHMETEYLIGLGTVSDRMLILMDIEKLMGSRSMGMLGDASLH